MRPKSFSTELVTKVKPNINSVEVHPQLSNNVCVQWMVCGGVLVHRGAQFDVFS
jgi:hypothetical protein